MYIILFSILYLFIVREFLNLFIYGSTKQPWNYLLKYFLKYTK